MKGRETMTERTSMRMTSKITNKFSIAFIVCFFLFSERDPSGINDAQICSHRINPLN